MNVSIRALVGLTVCLVLVFGFPLAYYGCAKKTEAADPKEKDDPKVVKPSASPSPTPAPTIPPSPAAVPTLAPVSITHSGVSTAEFNDLTRVVMSLQKTQGEQHKMNQKILDGFEAFSGRVQKLEQASVSPVIVSTPPLDPVVVSAKIKEGLAEINAQIAEEMRKAYLSRGQIEGVRSQAEKALSDPSKRTFRMESSVEKTLSDGRIVTDGHYTEVSAGKKPCAAPSPKKSSFPKKEVKPVKREKLAEAAEEDEPLGVEESEESEESYSLLNRPLPPQAQREKFSRIPQGVVQDSQRDPIYENGRDHTEGMRYKKNGVWYCRHNVAANDPDGCRPCESHADRRLKRTPSVSFVAGVGYVYNDGPLRGRRVRTRSTSAGSGSGAGGGLGGNGQGGGLGNS